MNVFSVSGVLISGLRVESWYNECLLTVLARKGGKSAMCRVEEGSYDGIGWKRAPTEDGDQSRHNHG